MPVFPINNISLKLFIILLKLSNFTDNFSFRFIPNCFMYLLIIFPEIAPKKNKLIKIKKVLNCLKKII